MVTRESILAANDGELKKISVPEWGGDVFIRSMSSRQRDKFEMQVQSKDFENMRARLVCAMARNEKGELLFKESDAAALGEKSVKPIQRVFNAIKIGFPTFKIRPKSLSFYGVGEFIC